MSHTSDHVFDEVDKLLLSMNMRELVLAAPPCSSSCGPNASAAAAHAARPKRTCPAPTSSEDASAGIALACGSGQHLRGAPEAGPFPGGCSAGCAGARAGAGSGNTCADGYCSCGAKADVDMSDAQGDAGGCGDASSGGSPLSQGELELLSMLLLDGAGSTSAGRAGVTAAAAAAGAGGCGRVRLHAKRRTQTVCRGRAGGC
jgi:hypothetical protein